MAQAKKRKNRKASPLTHHVGRGVREGALIVLLAVAAYLLVSLASYDAADPGWSQSGPVERIGNVGGRVGAWFADVSLYLIGYLAYLFPVMVGYSGWLVFRGRTEAGDIDYRTLGLRWFGFLLTVGAGCGLASLHFGMAPGSLPLSPGGILGDLIGEGLVSAFSFVGATLFLLALFLAGVTLFTGLSWLALMDHTGRLTLELVDWLGDRLDRLRDELASRRLRREREATVKVEKKKAEKRKPPRIEPVIKAVEPGEREAKERQVPLFDPPPDTELPPLMLLDPPRQAEGGYSEEALQAMSRLVEMKLADFGIEVEVVAVLPGPVITRFELQPGTGVKVSQISNLAKDLARALSAISVRVVEIIPGKSVVGLEIPNEHREIVALSEIIRSKDYEKSASPLTLALGKDISGLPVCADLARMPHLLVAGTTGSGKSVAINAMILSLLYKTLPRDVRLIMIDPKMLELSIYEGIPHLLTPVVTDMKEAANALRWCVAEMERRYQLMAALGVRNIGGYNRKVQEAIDAGEPIPDPLYKPEEQLDPEAPAPTLEPLPFIVVIIDELADLMMVVGKKVEELIARLAQKARAAGVHLILATQRPSVDVITGLIKANIPTRIAFQVSSKVDSRTILDQGGAEQLLGHGDMLYLPPGTGLPMRVHGAYVSDSEVHKVVNHLKGSGEPDYLEEITQGGVSGSELPGEAPLGGEDMEADPLYDQAVRIVTESRRASISGVQRRLKIGYNRAARMIEAMEAAGIVGPLQPNGSREVTAPPPPEA
ncbi:DNA translocase FtsK 4TM domain-containing protein [Thiohalobacter sp. IOR34]|uniref:DNA translocase FtsK n=1 Tax=Thiohalobacter sp. IOR34 TaxID=3057176 RepID=UPI0025B1908A|nr:DNA translocase FtsK [Thiohalobacter sp. IOR34]WJW74381.1 DNA translocase FtsK 4TM domain-containing protein [Thiohalobacter sp. IOR34]